MLSSQQQLDVFLKRMSVYARIAERAPGNIGGVFSHGHRANVFYGDAHTGQQANNVWNDDPQPNEATTLFRQQGGHPT
eukprot:7199439-Pyramimonas_sp.AAC.1